MSERVIEGWLLGMFVGGLLGPFVGVALAVFVGLPMPASIVGAGTLVAFIMAILADGLGDLVIEVDE